jgi:hypothetical protein
MEGKKCCKDVEEVEPSYIAGRNIKFAAEGNGLMVPQKGKPKNCHMIYCISPLLCIP